MFLKRKYSFKISMIGAGNVASLLAPTLESAGHVIKEVYSRHKKNAQALCDQLYEAEVNYNLDFSRSTASIFFIAVPDDRIGEVVEQIILPAASILIHTSGSMPMQVLKGKDHVSLGVFYPLQTFTKNKAVHFQDIPLLIEASDASTLKTIKILAESISKQVQEMSSEQRAILHIAAVFSCNFTNHLILLAEELTDNHQIDFDLLKPLIAETVNKSLNIGPRKAQTGPAARRDIETLQRHTHFLKGEDKRLAKLYQLLSDSIMGDGGQK
ncbi:Rossmann-like and DUF2520 domain-containing protein [Catalinimonas niigatensis]|uniref:Rossmann-like and DUF2520 domain-containing protein n=1 Tax=Catalinimonas niigatensis TaxID=1397264 RepID=UPI0026666C43|nr:Rossmann-like and DUF2520 domain-containing protein [Catalinimonas niigatensis]WPP51037.1 Rossmann-like and DUF2520 domain-containing protein [Catalinimonas niigatensis]